MFLLKYVISRIGCQLVWTTVLLDPLYKYQAVDLLRGPIDGH
jgi:hypothetical protein